MLTFYEHIVHKMYERARYVQSMLQKYFKVQMWKKNTPIAHFLG